MPGQTGPKFTPTEREGVLEKVAELDRRGWSTYRIAEAVGVSRPQVSGYLKKIRRRYVEEQVGSHAELVAVKRAEYREVREHAWAAYLASASDKEREVEESGLRKAADDATGSGRGAYETSMVLIKRITTREGRLPASEYLTVICHTLDAERKMLGLDEPDRVDLLVGAVDWDKLARDYRASGSGDGAADPVTERLEREKAKGPGGRKVITYGRGPDGQPVPLPEGEGVGGGEG